jgi:uncharacterized surface protein with fasciclin (FAS1) repeats
MMLGTGAVIVLRRQGFDLGSCLLRNCKPATYIELPDIPEGIASGSRKRKERGMKASALLMAGAAGMTVALGANALSAAGIVETLKNQSGFETFAKALEQTDFAEMLEEDGTYTVFAPTDAAFARLPETTVEELMTEDFADELEALVGYHIVEGKLRIEPLIGKSIDIDTLLDEPITLDGTHNQQLVVVPIDLELIEKDDVLYAESTRSDQPAIELQADADASPESAPDATMNEQQKSRLILFPARITEPDIRADNGFIHAIDAVLLPKESRMMIKYERKENQLGDQSGG